MTVQKGFSKRDFSCGQYDREYQAAQTEISSRGMIYSRNLISSPLREIKTRPGTKFLQRLDSPAKLIPYRIDTNDMVLVMQDGIFSGYDFDENFNLVPRMVYSGDAPTMPNSGWTANTNGDWSVAFSPTTATSFYPMCNNVTGRPIKYRGTGTVISTRPTTTNEPAYLNITNSAENVYLSSVIVRFVLSCAGNHTGHYKGWRDPILQWSDDGNNWTSVKTRVDNPYATGGANEYQASYHYGSGSGEFTENYTVYRVSNDSSDYTGHKYWRIFFTTIIFNNQTYGNERLEILISNNGGPQFLPTSPSQYVVNDSPITINDLPNLKYSQDSNQLIIAMKGKQPYEIKFAGGEFTNQPFSPSSTTGFWDTQGYPAAVAHYQNRLWFAGFTLNPNRVCSSAFGNYQDFSIPTTLLASSPIIADCNQMKSMITDIFGGWDVLYAQCDEGIATVEAGDSAVAPNNMSFLLKVRKRSGGVTPTIKEDMMFWVGNDRKTIYAIQYDLIARKYHVADITKFCHSYLDSGVEELHYVDTAARLIYGSLRNGNMFALLYDSEAQVIGLFPIETSGTIYDLSVIQANDEVRLLAVIQRDGVWAIEMFNPVKELEGTDLFLQTWYEKNAATKRNLISQPFIDCATTIKDERQEIWNFDATSRILSGTFNLYAWNADIPPGTGFVFYTDSDDPQSNDNVYSETGEILDGYELRREEDKIYVTLPSLQLYICSRDSTKDVKSTNTDLSQYAQKVIRFFTSSGNFYDLRIVGSPAAGQYNVEVVAGDAGESADFVLLQMPISSITPSLVIPNGVYQYFDSGQYKGNITADNDGVINFTQPVYDLTYGFGYTKIGVIQDNMTYLRKKKWGTIALNVMDTMSLQIGTKLDKMDNVMKWKGTDFFNSSPIMRNGILIKNISDSPENDKQLIFKTDEGLPFCIRAIEAGGEITDRNGN